MSKRNNQGLGKLVYVKPKKLTKPQRKKLLTQLGRVLTGGKDA